MTKTHGSHLSHGLFARDSTVLPLDDDLLAKLTADQQEQLAEILEKYLADLEAGVEVDREAILRAHPTLADAIASYLDSVTALHQAGIAVTSAVSDDSANFVCDALDKQIVQSARLGDYRIKDEIGRGGMGIVYEAEQISLGRRVAIKMLPFASVMDQKQVARFKNEAQAAAGLHHPNIVPVYAVGHERGIHYFSMQLIEGQSLEDAISQLRGAGKTKPAKSPSKTTANQFSTQQSIHSQSFARSVAQLGKQAADALHYAHENGVVHRDIKPSNLLLDADSKLWITDFGLARISGATNLTLSGAMIGTARYMSPEQAAARMHEVDHRSDIYSLGITLYELLTLQPAFDGLTRQELLRAVETQQPESPRTLNASIPTDLETIVLKAIEKDRDDRYRSAAELAEDLQHFLEGRPTNAKRPGTIDHLSRWISKHQLTVAATTVLLVIALVGVSAVAAMLHSKNQVIEAQKTQIADEAATAALFLRESQRAVDNFGAKVDQRLEHLPGSSQLRKELLGELEKYYSAFLQQAGDDQALAVDLATTRFRLAAVYQRMGDFDSATDGYQQALAGFEELLRQSPDDLDRLADVAICHNNLGQVAAKRGDESLAKQHYQSAIVSYAELAEQGHPRGSSGVARTQMNLGLLLSAAGDPEATTVLEAALKALGELASQTPDDLGLLDQLALCENNLAALVMETDLQRAESLLESAVARYQRLESERPASPEHLADHALARGNLAAIVARRGQPERSQQMLSEVVEIRRLLIKLEPSLVSRHYDLAVAYQQLGQLMVGSQRYEAARQHYADSRQVLTAVSQRSAKHHRILSSLGRTVSNLGIIEARLGNQQQALELLEQAADYQQQAIELMPANLAYQQLLDHHQDRIKELKSGPSQDGENGSNNESEGG